MMPSKHAAVVAFVATGFLLSGPAHAWKFIEDSPYAWNPEDLPVQYYVAEAANCEETVPQDYCVDVMERAHRAWDVGAPCADLGGGEYIGPTPSPEGNNGFEDDGRNTVGFNDILDQNDNTGVLAANLTYRGGTAFVLDGETFRWVDNSDVVFNDDVDFVTHYEVGGGNCGGRINMLSVAIHEVGHLYGLGHSCENGEPCPDPRLKNAIMYWTSEPCDIRDELQEDDIEGINALYGPSVQFACSHEVIEEDVVIGVVPLELKCVVASDFLNEIVDVQWNFGNGTSLTGNQVSTTYTETGNYTIEVNVTGQRDDCVSDENVDGNWKAKFRKVGYVRACDLPVVGFSIDHVDGLQYQMLNESDVSVFGCIQDIEWQVYKGSKPSGKPLSALTKKAWEPLITFPDDGVYTVVMNVGGIAGTSAATATIDARKHRGEGRGCSHAGLAGLGSTGIVLALLGVVARRRRMR